MVHSLGTPLYWPFSCPNQGYYRDLYSGCGNGRNQQFPGTYSKLTCKSTSLYHLLNLSTFRCNKTLRIKYIRYNKNILFFSDLARKL